MDERGELGRQYVPAATRVGIGGAAVAGEMARPLGLGAIPKAVTAAAADAAVAPAEGAFAGDWGVRKGGGVDSDVWT